MAAPKSQSAGVRHNSKKGRGSLPKKVVVRREPLRMSGVSR